MSVAGLVAALETLDVEVLSKESVTSELRVLARVRSWCDATQIRLAARLQELAVTDGAIFPEDAAAKATRLSRAESDKAFERAATVAAVAGLGGLLDAGSVTVGHVDAFTRALDKLEPDQRDLLMANVARLTAVACRSTPEHLARVLNRTVSELNDGVDRFDKQRRATALRIWLDRTSGMFRLSGEFDPENGLRLIRQLGNAVDAMFHEGTPETCPSDPGAKQDHLRALALLHLTSGHHDGIGRVEMSIVVDLDTLVDGLHAKSLIDTGTAAVLPVETLRRLGCEADLIPAVLNSAGVCLDLGRTTRLANRAQRRALWTMYQTCAIPGCTVTSRHCQPHHIHWWRRGGHTDIVNLLPLCSKHHHSAHEGGWQLHLDTDRQLTITYPNGTIQTTGPPAQQRAA